MTEYGRGQGSEPWHPEDPLYGDDGWGGQQAHAGQQSPYGGQPQHYPEQPQQQQQYYDGGWGEGQQAHYGQAQQYQQYDQQYYAGQGQQQSYDQQAWGQGTHTHVQYTDPQDPYAQQASAGYGGEQPDYYGTQDAYPPPEPPSRRQAEPEPPQTDWDPGPDQGEHAFFAGDGDGDADEEDEDVDPGEGRKGRGGKKPKKKSRNGVACLVLVLVFGGGAAGVGYFGWQFYQNRFGPAPDYAGQGDGAQVTVVIPKGAGGYVIGQKLKEAGVVKSVDAFVSAQQSNPDGKKIQDGVYTLEKQMSAASAVELMLSPKSRSNLIIREGLRNSQVYALLDARLGLAAGTTAKVAKNDYKKLGLPSWALNHPNLKDPLEGFLYPSSYAATKGQKPEAVLKDMVTRANDKYEELGLRTKAKSLGLDSPWQLLTVASLVQAEGTSHDDFRKMAEVVYNRLKPGNPETYGSLEFDSTYNYVKNQSKIDLSIAELRKYNNPYNTYYVKGLPPGPIDNPGEEAIKGALDPTHDGWYYFISLDGKTSKFTKTLAEHDRLVQEFNASRNKN
ncbi:endolytic transglycosylase MltG [Streptomyces griseorubiginosus]|uniref:endolytic transglycosylase MltG n=1 Tax=Streptomyces griseorubiginosus TaxID=67304 RepID=UPI001AD73FEF|nr:endolytic transglycosylase MltG [Streptomyces griseorubiginosus]MBO4256547.1 endolytic transglycosylase MltG [Streptomyces griseorubiginosus]